jgi:hypothetical protein
VVLLAEDAKLQALLRNFGIETQTTEEVAPINIRSPDVLVNVYSMLGKSDTLGLNGRPERPIGMLKRDLLREGEGEGVCMCADYQHEQLSAGSLGTSKLYRIDSQLYAFTPWFMQASNFYLTCDNDFLARMLENELRFVSTNWRSTGRPTMCVLLTHRMFAVSRGTTETLSLVTSLKSGSCNGVPVRLGALAPLVGTSCVENLRFVNEASRTQLQHIREILSESSNDVASSIDGTESSGALGEAQQQQQQQRGHKAAADDDDVRNVLGAIAELLHNSVVPPTPLPVSDSNWRWERLLRISSNDELVFEFDCDASCAFLEEPRSLKVQANFVEALIQVCRATVEQYGLEAPQSAAAIRKALASSIDPARDDDLCCLAVASDNGVDQERLAQLRRASRPIPSDELKQRALAATRKLADILYVRACRVKNWAIVRQTASLACKSADSVTSALVELLVHQKQLTIGGESGVEHLFSTPLTPAELHERIYRYGGKSDSRNAVLLQELLLNLASLIKAAPSLFDGIVRIRMHFLIQALEIELSRLLRSLNQCSTTNIGAGGDGGVGAGDAGCSSSTLERLYECSPANLKSLLFRVLSAHPRAHGQQPDEHLLAIMESHSASLVSALGATSNIVLRVQSAGYHDGNFARIQVDDVVAAPNLRGINCVTVNHVTGKVEDARCFDTHISDKHANDFAAFVEYLPVDTYVLLSVKDEAAKSLNENAMRAAESLGSAKVRELAFRDSWCMIGKKGSVPGSVPESLMTSRSGATPVLRQKIHARGASHRRASRDAAAAVAAAAAAAAASPSLVDNDEAEDKDSDDGDMLEADGDDAANEPDDVASTTATASSVASSSSVHAPGAWFRRRQLDGALNRVPELFYTHVWQILDWSATGLSVYGRKLARVPTVQEKTPEEWNFAIAVECLLDAVPAPEDRTVAAICLAMIWVHVSNHRQMAGADARENEHRDFIDIEQLINSAICEYWLATSQSSIEQFVAAADEAKQSFYDQPSATVEHYLSAAIAKAFAQ